MLGLVKSPYFSQHLIDFSPCELIIEIDIQIERQRRLRENGKILSVETGACNRLKGE